MTKHSLAASCALTLATFGLVSTSFAGTEAPAKEMKALKEVEKAKVVSGVLNLDVNTHFISYGQDVWAAGNAWDDVLFNPSLELSLSLGGGFNFILGTWWDVNDNANSSIGGKAIQEVDVWAGFSYATGPLTFKLLYQEWMYAEASERIVDFSVGYDHWLKPSVTIHGRVEGNGAQEEGVVGVLGVAPGLPVGPLSVSFPVNVAFATDNYFGGDGGFAYVSAGASASIPVPFLPGDWSFHAGVTYYHTQDEIYPTNPDSDFVTGNAGLTLSF